jgi:hypothetical protein
MKVNIIIEVNNLLRNNYPYQQLYQDYKNWGNYSPSSPSRQQSPTNYNAPNYLNNYNPSPLPNFGAFNNRNKQ